MERGTQNSSLVCATFVSAVAPVGAHPLHTERRRLVPKKKGMATHTRAPFRLELTDVLIKDRGRRIARKRSF